MVGITISYHKHGNPSATAKVGNLIKNGRGCDYREQCIEFLGE